MPKPFQTAGVTGLMVKAMWLILPQSCGGTGGWVTANDEVFTRWSAERSLIADSVKVHQKMTLSIYHNILQKNLQKSLLKMAYLSGHHLIQSCNTLLVLCCYFNSCICIWNNHCLCTCNNLQARSNDCHSPWGQWQWSFCLVIISMFDEKWIFV